MNRGELILYRTEDGLSEVSLRAEGGTVWLCQDELAKLFDKSRSTIAEHISNIFADQELNRDSVCRNFRRTAVDGKTYSTIHYNLDVILAVGFRVHSQRGVQFRRWANTTLREYLVKGFAMNDQALKHGEQGAYFDELLARIRDIRASEKRFYQKVKALYATAVDYDKTSEAAKLFFKKVQNKMLWAVTGQTAAELIAARSDPSRPNMGLTSWKGSVVRRGDVGIAKNYLKQDEIEPLNRIVTMYLDYAEEQAKQRSPVTMAQWSEKLDAFLKFHGRALLTHSGKVKTAVAAKLAEEHYQQFDDQRRKVAAVEADEADSREIEALIEQTKQREE